MEIRGWGNGWKYGGGGGNGLHLGLKVHEITAILLHS